MINIFELSRFEIGAKVIAVHAIAEACRKKLGKVEKLKFKFEV